MREAGVPASYRAAFGQAKPAYEACVKRVGMRISGDIGCLLREGQKLKSPYSGVWTD